MDQEESLSHQPRHPIGVVSRRTGLKPDLIRAWERRYSAVEPERSPTRRRLYSDLDVERLLLLKEATREGRSIGQVASQSNQELEALIAEDRAALARRTAPRDQREAPSPAAFARPSEGDEDEAQTVATLLEGCLAAIRRLDGTELELQLDRASLELSRVALVERLIAPLMQRIGALWQDGTLRPIHEHLASAVIRTFVGGLREAFPTSSSAPRAVFTTPSGHLHEMGALLAATTAASEGWNVTYLGPSLPAEEIAAATLRTSARVVALGLTYPPDDPSVSEELLRLGRLLDGSRLVVGGRAIPSYSETLERLGAVTIKDLGALRGALADLR